MIIDMPTVSMGNSGSVLPAEKVSYDNTTSGLEAENVQDAIDEVNSNLDELNKKYKHGDVLTDLFPRNAISMIFANGKFGTRLHVDKSLEDIETLTYNIIDATKLNFYTFGNTISGFNPTKVDAATATKIDDHVIAIEFDGIYKSGTKVTGQMVQCAFFDADGVANISCD